MFCIMQFTSGFICNLCQEKQKIVYAGPCFEFGDCIDKGQDDNTFWISQLDSYLRQSTSHLTNAFTTIERKINKRDSSNVTIFDGTPQQICAPTQKLSQNAAFLRKMHSAYRLSELARKCKIMGMDIIAQVLQRLHAIAKDINIQRINNKNPPVWPTDGLTSLE
jgi:hypothetical protein